MIAELSESRRLSTLEKIGEGGSSIVYKARHPKHGEVAIKLALDGSPATIERFRFEYLLLRSLSHPGIISLYDFGWTDDGRPLIVTELLAGGNLYGFTDSLPPPSRFSMLDRFLSAVEYLHTLGIVHRDLKGDNILLDTDRHPKLTDLGLAGVASGQNDAKSGTVEYMAPEVAETGKGGIPADIYSIGVILYRIAAGKLPCTGNDPVQIISQKRQPERIDYAFLENALPQRLIETIKRCLAPDPEARFKSVAEIHEQVRLASLSGEAEGREQGFSQFYHHHLSSFNTSFLHQEIKDFASDYLVVDHCQPEASDFLSALEDHFRVNVKEVEQPEDSATSHYLGKDNVRHEVRVVPETPERPGTYRLIEFAELDSLTLYGFLQRLFPGGIDRDSAELLSYYSGGNFRLLKIVIKALEDRGFIVKRQGGWSLQLIRHLTFTPPSDYYLALKDLVPQIADHLAGTVSFLAADRFGNPRDVLIEKGEIEPSHLDQLVNSKVLRADDYQFRAGYMAEFLYQQTETDKRHRLHQRWIEILEDGVFTDLSNRDEQLYYHLSASGRIEKALEVALSLARNLRQNAEPERARKIVADARSLAAVEKLCPLRLELIMLSADLAKDAGDLNQALSDYAVLVRLAKKTDHRELLAETYKDLGDVYRSRRDYRRGNHVLDKAVALYGALGNELELSHCFNNIGNIHWMAGNLDAAEVNYETALEIQRRLEARKDIASTLNNLATSRCIQKKYAEGIALFKESMLIAREIREYGEVARTANNIAYTYAEQNELQLAREYLEESLKWNRSLGARKELLFNYENLFQIENQRGKYDHAFKAVLAGLKLAERNDYAHRGIFVTMLARLMLKQGRYGKADELLGAASKYRQNVTYRFLDLELAGARAEYYRLLHDFEAALQYLTESLEHAEKLGEIRHKAKLLMELARLRAGSGAERGTVVEVFRQADETLQQLPIKREKLELLIDIARFYFDLNESSEAEAFFKEACRFPAFDGIETLWPHISLLNGRLERRAGNSHKAVSLFHDAMIMFRTMKLNEEVWRAQVALAETYEELFEYEQALKNYIEAFRIMRDLASSIKDRRLKKLYLRDPEKERVAALLERLTARVG